jgi:putative Ca2+/H+ antiporter (TMEM165/GDT1 family)
VIIAFFTSAAVVALAELGDKTMLLTIVLATRLRAPWQVLGGVLVGTVANHALAAWVGSEAAGLIDAQWFRVAVALGFVAMAGWMLFMHADDDDEESFRPRGNAFITALVAFFLVEMGDMTQIATVALAAKFHSVVTVVAGTTFGMTLVATPTVFLGRALIARISLKAAHRAAALVFLGLGIWQLAEQLA